MSGATAAVPQSGASARRTAMLRDALDYYALHPVAYVEDMILGGVRCQGGGECRHGPRTRGCGRRRDAAGETIRVRPEQADVLNLVVAYPRVAVRAANGVGKDTVTAWLIEWFLLTHYKAKIPVISATGRQVKRTIFAEVGLWTTESVLADKVDLMMTNEVRMRADHQWAAFGFAPKISANDPTGSIEGIHAEHLLFVITEAKAVDPAVWDAAERIATRPGNKVFCQSVPGIAAGGFYECFTTRAKAWQGYHFPSARPVVQPSGRIEYVPTTPLVDAATIAAKLEAGVDAPNFRAGVLAEFLPNDPRALIPLAWVEAAQARWRSLEAAGTLAHLDAHVTAVGLDLGFGGSDRTSLARRHGAVITGLQRPPGDTMQAAGMILLETAKGARAVVDAIGAAGVVDRLRELAVPVLPFVASAKTEARDRTGELGFVNLRAAAWWGLRDRLDPEHPEPVALPPDAMLTGDLTAPKWWLTSAGRIQVEGKDEIRRRLGRSTDDGDAVVMVFAAEIMDGTPFAASVQIEPTRDTYHATPASVFGPRPRGGVWRR